MTQREKFLSLAHSRLGLPYVWASKGPESFDCSGLVAWAFRESGGPDWTKTHWTQRFFDSLPAVSEGDVRPGDLALYGRTVKAINHVVICCGPGCEGKALGANGGDSTTTSPARAKARGASVCHRSGPKYRFDFQGFRRLPFKDETA